MRREQIDFGERYGNGSPAPRPFKWPADDPNCRRTENQRAAWERLHYCRWRASSGTQSKRWKAEADELRNRLVIANLGCAGMIGQRARVKGDVMLELRAHLLHLVERFDPRRGCRFATFAWWGLRRHIWNSQRRKALWFQPLPMRLVGEDGHRETDNADELAVLVTKAQLAPRELEVIRGRFGLGTSTMTLQEIGDMRQLSKERVRQIERTALGKLRAAATG